MSFSNTDINTNTCKCHLSIDNINIIAIIRSQYQYIVIDQHYCSALLSSLWRYVGHKKSKNSNFPPSPLIFYVYFLARTYGERPWRSVLLSPHSKNSILKFTKRLDWDKMWSSFYNWQFFKIILMKGFFNFRCV